MENNILYMEFLSPNMEPGLTSMEAGSWNLACRLSIYMESSPQKNGTRCSIYEISILKLDLSLKAFNMSFGILISNYLT